MQDERLVTVSKTSGVAVMDASPYGRVLSAVECEGVPTIGVANRSRTKVAVVDSLEMMTIYDVCATRPLSPRRRPQDTAMTRAAVIR